MVWVDYIAHTTGNKKEEKMKNMKKMIIGIFIVCLLFLILPVSVIAKNNDIKYKDIETGIKIVGLKLDDALEMGLLGEPGKCSIGRNDNVHCFFGCSWEQNQNRH